MLIHRTFGTMLNAACNTEVNRQCERWAQSGKGKKSKNRLKTCNKISMGHMAHFYVCTFTEQLLPLQTQGMWIVL